VILPPVIVYSNTNNRPPPWNVIFSEVRNEILIQGITLESLNRVASSIETAAKQNKKVKILLCKPDTPLMDYIKTLVVSTKTASRSESAMQMLKKIRQGWVLMKDLISKSDGMITFPRSV
jgi:hypothetical protein